MNVLDFIKQSLIGKRVYFPDSQTEGEILNVDYNGEYDEPPLLELFYRT